MTDDIQSAAVECNAAGALDTVAMVVAMCAQWCHLCRSFRETFDRLAATRSDVRFVWLDGRAEL